MGSKQLKTCGLIRKAIKIGEQVVLSSLDFSDLWKLELSAFFWAHLLLYFLLLCFYHSEKQFTRLYCRTILPYCKAKCTKFQEGYYNFDRASRRALIKSRLTSISFSLHRNNWLFKTPAHGNPSEYWITDCNRSFLCMIGLSIVLSPLPFC